MRPDYKPAGFGHWQNGKGEYEIESVWWRARALHFPKDNCTHWYNGSELVGIETWGYLGYHWAMKKPPADWQPRPAGYVEEAERIWFTYRIKLHHKARHTARLKRKRYELDPVPFKCLEAVG